MYILQILTFYKFGLRVLMALFKFYYFALVVELSTSMCIFVYFRCLDFIKTSEEQFEQKCFHMNSDGQN